MLTRVFHFCVDGYGNIHPQFDAEEALQAMEATGKVQLSITGDRDSSLIAITAAADYFDSRREEEVDWQFQYNESVQPNRIVVILTIEGVYRDAGGGY